MGTTTGLIHLYAGNSLQHTFPQQQTSSLSKGGSCPITHLSFVKGVYLVAIDGKSQIHVYSLLSLKLLSITSAPGVITCVEADPSQDWVWIGLNSGVVVCFDVENGVFVKYRIENQQKRRMPGVKSLEVKGIQWSPRDLGSLLITYSNMAMVYSIEEQTARVTFHYEVEANAPGGDGLRTNRTRYPKFVKCCYNPNSLHMVSLHEDNSLVFWDVITGKLILARTLTEVGVNLAHSVSLNSSNDYCSATLPIIDIKWCCGSDPERTSLCIIGGGERMNTLTVWDFGHSPKYSLSSYDYMASHYSKPKQQHIRAFESTTASGVITHATMLARSSSSSSSPHFSQAHDPSHLLVWFSSGQFQTLTYPDLHSVINPTELLPVALSWTNATTSCANEVQRNKWLGMLSTRSHGHKLINGGTKTLEDGSRLSQRELRTAVTVGCSDGTVSLYDGCSFGEMDLECVLSVNVNQTLGCSSSSENVGIVATSYATDLADLAVATEQGDVLLYRYAMNPNYDPKAASNSSSSLLAGQMQALSLNNNNKPQIVDLRSRCPQTIKEGFLPMHLLRLSPGSSKVTALANSNLHFLSVAYDNGEIYIIDRRGPAVIHKDSILNNTSTNSSSVVSLKFSIMAYGDDSYSSILLYAGTDRGEVFVYKILPESASGRFKAQLVDVIATGGDSQYSEVRQLLPIKTATGTPCVATAFDFDQLSSGNLIQGLLIVQTQTSVFVYSPGKHSRGGSLKERKFKNNLEILTAGIVVVALDPSLKSSKGRRFAVCLTVVCKDATVRILTVPDLKELAGFITDFGSIDPLFGRQSSVLASGDVLLRTSATSSSLLSIVQAPSKPQSKPVFFNEQRLMPQRPILQGTQSAFKQTLTSSQLNSILSSSSPRRVSKTPESQIAAKIINTQPSLFSSSSTSTSSSTTSNNNDLSYTAPHRHRYTPGYDPSRYIAHQWNAGLDSLGETMDGYVQGANDRLKESVKGMKEDMVKGVIKSKFGL